MYFPAGMLDEWNPYEGMHQHVTAFATMLSLDIVDKVDTVIFQGDISNHRNFPLLSMWKHTFKRVEYGNTIVCAKKMIIPPSSERSLNTFHKKTCDDKFIASQYSMWMLKDISPQKSDILISVRPRSLRRNERNMKEFVSILKKHYNVKEIVMHKKNFKEQLEYINGCKVFFSTHGASLSLLYALDKCAQIIEIGVNGLAHYRYMAKLWNKGYMNIRTKLSWEMRSYTIPIDKSIENIKKAMHSYHKCMNEYK